MPKKYSTPALSCLLAAALSGCAVGPTYKAPALTSTPRWQAPLPHGGKEGQLTEWWSQFNDPTVAQLVALAEARSTSLAQAWASIEEARATLVTNQAAALPTLEADASATRARSQGTTGMTVATSRAASLDASWELDLFGKLRRNSAAASARLEAEQASWHDARVSLAAEVADDYVQYRGCLLLERAYARAARSNEQTLKLTTTSAKAGFTSASDLATSDASAASALATYQSQQLSCQVLLKSLVELTGMEEPALQQLMSRADLPELPQPAALRVPEVPADALRQRPDLAALEREVAARSEEIGAAQADLYPSLSLSGLVTTTLSAGTRATTWSFGPSASLPLFDGGKRRAAVTTAEAAYLNALASYRAGVRTAIKEVEQALARLNSTALREANLARASTGYRKAFDATEQLWRAGSTSLLSLEETRRSAISAEIDLISMQQSRVQYWIALYKALGGGWDPAHPQAQAPASDSLSE